MSLSVFITGTSSGFGRLTALALAERGHRVFATMRDVRGRNRALADELEARASQQSGSIRVVEMELGSQASVDAAVLGALAEAGHLDAVINNAGYMTVGLAETFTDAQVASQLDINVIGPQRVLRAVLPGMRSRKQGLLVHVSSTMGRLVTPLLGTYCASKAALEALVDAYRYELAPLGIEATIVQPGGYPSNLLASVEQGKDRALAGEYGPLAGAAEQYLEVCDAMCKSPDAPDPRDVARAIVGVVESEPGTRPDRVVIDYAIPRLVETLNDHHRTAQQQLFTVYQPK